MLLVGQRPFTFAAYQQRQKKQSIKYLKMRQEINTYINLKVYLRSCILFVFLCVVNEANSQRKTYRNSVLESLSVGVMPKFSDSTILFFQKRNESATVLYRIIVDTTGFIKDFNRIPLLGIGNTLDSNSCMWHNIYNTIEESIKMWKFKPDLWSLRDKETEAQLNRYSKTRPHGGYQFFLILFTVNSDIQHNPIYSEIFN
jgi:hypothetical protein